MTKQSNKVLPNIPGIFCPNCGQDRIRPVRQNPYDPYDTWVEDPHIDPFECIRYLKETIQNLRDDIPKNHSR